MFLTSIMFALAYFICSIFININWFNDIACSFGYIRKSAFNWLDVFICNFYGNDSLLID